MKIFTILFLAIALLINVGRVHSQMSNDPQSPAAIMAAMKATNTETLARQTATLQALDQLVQDANQIKIFAKRG